MSPKFEKQRISLQNVMENFHVEIFSKVVNVCYIRNITKNSTIYCLFTVLNEQCDFANSNYEMF